MKKTIRKCLDCGKKGDQEKLFFFIIGDIWSCHSCTSKNTEIVKTEKRKKKQKPQYNDIEFDSSEEIEFYQWCEEAKQEGLIIDFIYQPPSYTLSTKQTHEVPVKLKTKVRIDEKTLLQPHIFTPDFQIFSKTHIPDFKSEFLCEDVVWETIIDIKAVFSKFHDSKVFSINQKWLYDKHGVYVNKVIPEKLFKKTWVPEKAKLTLNEKRIKKKYIGFRSVADYLNGAE